MSDPSTNPEEAKELTPQEIVVVSLAMFQEVLEARAIVRDGTKSERLALHNRMCDALDYLYKGKEALGQL